MADSSLKKWYVVRAVSGQENKVKTYIDNEINRLHLSDFISQVLVPTEKVVQVRDGKKIAKDKCDEVFDLIKEGCSISTYDVWHSFSSFLDQIKKNNIKFIV